MSKARPRRCHGRRQSGGRLPWRRVRGRSCHDRGKGCRGRRRSGGRLAWAAAGGGVRDGGADVGMVGGIGRK
jgi:hypothetical protein